MSYGRACELITNNAIVLRDMSRDDLTYPVPLRSNCADDMVLEAKTV